MPSNAGNCWHCMSIGHPFKGSSGKSTAMTSGACSWARSSPRKCEKF